MYILEVIGNRLVTKVLKYYDSVYCEVFFNDIKDSYVIEYFQNGLERLEWEKFVPNLNDLNILNDVRIFYYFLGCFSCLKTLHYIPAI